MKQVNGKTITVALIAVLLFSCINVFLQAQDNFNIQSTSIEVYRDGLAHIMQLLTVDELKPQITMPLLSASIDNLVVLDASNIAVDFEVSGSNLNIFTFGATQITIEYDTVSLTSKQAEVWSINMNNPYNLTLFLPENSTIIYLNHVPTQINTETNKVSIVVSPNQWEISYIIPLQQENNDDDRDDGSSNSAIPIEFLVIGAIVIVLIIVILLLFYIRKRKINVKKTINRNPHLSKEDKAVIEFLAEKEGKAFEAEIRQRFPDMPRTSLWRLIKRLEKAEIIEVEKIGLENQVKLKK